MLWRGLQPIFSTFAHFVDISYLEARSHYHGTRLGLLWILVSTLILTTMLALVFCPSDTMPLANSYLYVLSGFTLWQFIQGSITGSKKNPLTARIDINDATVTFYLHRTAEAVMEERGVGAQIIVGQRYLELNASKNTSISLKAGDRVGSAMSLLRRVRGETLLMDEWINAADPSLIEAVDELQTRLIERSEIRLPASHFKPVGGQIWAQGSDCALYTDSRDVLNLKRREIRSA